jgi:DNA-binding HxlR family transcriptional regulator
MYKYGQYCPVARAAEILGDRWTLLVVREMLLGTRHFNELERGLPGISRALLAERLRRLQRMEIVEKRVVSTRPRKTEYWLTTAGQELQIVIDVLMAWGARWQFGEPEPDELDPILLLWWMRGRVRREELPQDRVVVQFDFVGAVEGRYWLILAAGDVSVCLKYPGFDVDVQVTADLARFLQVWLGRIRYEEALKEQWVVVDAIPSLRRAFPRWFAWSPAAATVRSALSAVS